MMRVISPENEYSVIARLQDGRRYHALDRTGRFCLLVIEKRPHEAKRLVTILTNWRQISEFSDFYEFFPYKSGIAAVFAGHTEGTALEDSLADMPYTHRAVVLRSLFAFIMRQNLPLEILISVISPENIRVYPGGKTQLMYDMPYYDKASLKKTAALICGEACAPELDRLFAEIEDLASIEYTKLYSAAGLASDALAGYQLPEDNKKLTADDIKERVAAIKSAAAGRIAAVAAVAAILAGFIAAGLLFYKAVINPPRVDNGISAIGSVVIDDDG